MFYFVMYPVALCFYAGLLVFLGKTLESKTGLPIACIPVFLVFFVPGALVLLVSILRDLRAHSRFDPSRITE